MTNEGVLDLVKRCNLKKGIELIPGEAYLFDRKFKIKSYGISNCMNKFIQMELIVLIKNGKKVGGIYRMGTADIHIVIKERYRGQHIMSNFLKKGIIKKIWPENISVEFCDLYTRSDYVMRKHLVALCNMTIRNEAEIESYLDRFDPL